MFLLLLFFSFRLICLTFLRYNFALILFADGRVFTIRNAKSVSDVGVLAGAECVEQFPQGVGPSFASFKMGGWCRLLPSLTKISLTDMGCSGIDAEVLFFVGGRRFFFTPDS